jgi:hypothetical protein
MKKNDLLQTVRRILFTEWDPIGVNDNPLCENEYDSYAPAICRLLREGADEGKVVSHLNRLQKDSMRLSATEEHNRRFARRLLSLTEGKRNFSLRDSQ